ncbi:hypothetical protein B0T11DRAFT_287660 [Plectosphaerella cucumerina]|uniref:Helix-turn-helix domain-containing protein n=1 Tax=Plectosphaerella cucumerina TaxID=40658 RepID=A0A8K0TEM0_9PEZI|nr:hypothetical protein B0T11DRAFT_287660 [Plectosphaerella cucumerina]
MGSASSKAARGAGRKFPTRAPGASPIPPRPAAPAAAQASRQPPPPQDAYAAPDPSAPLEAHDVTADYSARLRQMPVAEPNPTYSPSSRAGTPLGPDPSLARPDAAPTPSAGGAPVYPSASRNTTLGALEARRALEARAASEFDSLGRAGSAGRELVNASTLAQMVLLRDRGVSDAAIEERFDLRPGTVAKMGRRGIAVLLSSQVARAQQVAERR